MTRRLPTRFVIESSELNASLTDYPILANPFSRFWSAVEHSLTTLARQHADPNKPGAYKTPFRVTFEDGDTYEGRLDIAHPDRGNPISCELDAGAHIARFLEVHAGRRCPEKLSEDAYDFYLKVTTTEEQQLTAANFRDAYALNDHEIEAALIAGFNADDAGREELQVWLKERNAEDVVDAIDRQADPTTCKDLYDAFIEVSGGEQGVLNRNDKIAWVRMSTSAEAIREKTILIASTTELRRYASDIKQRFEARDPITTLDAMDAAQAKEFVLDHASDATLVDLADRLRADFEVFADEPGQYGPAIQDGGQARNFIDAEVDARDLLQHLRRFAPASALDRLAQSAQDQHDENPTLAGAQL